PGSVVVVARGAVDQLQRHAAVEALVVGPEDRAHPPLPEQVLDEVAVDAVSGPEHRIRPTYQDPRRSCPETRPAEVCGLTPSFEPVAAVGPAARLALAALGALLEGGGRRQRGLLGHRVAQGLAGVLGAAHAAGRAVVV